MKPKLPRNRGVGLLLIALCGAVSGLIWFKTAKIIPANARAAIETSGGSSYDLEGKEVDPLSDANAPAVVLIFLGIDCPISNRYAPEIGRLNDEFSAKGVKLWVVYPDADTPTEDIIRHQTTYHLPPNALRDPAHALVALSHAHITPEAAVFRPGSQLVYHGRIDNREVDFGITRSEATEHELRHVLEQIVQGKPVKPTATRAVGCYIAELK